MDSMQTPLPESMDIPQRKVDTLLQHYGLSHTHPVNEVIHFVAIPAIMLSLNGLLFAVHPVLVLLLIAASLVYYARLSWPFTLCMLLLSSVMLALVDAMDAAGVLVQASVGIFVVAWIFQFIGHHLEGKKPSFFKDIQFLLIGPAWLMSFIYKKLGVNV